MGKLVLSRKPGESIDVYDPANECFGPIVITQGKISGGKSSIAIDAPKNVHVKRSEISDKQAENKYFWLGSDPLAAIAAIGFTRQVSLFGCYAYRHESLPLDMRHENHRDGWRCVLDGEEVVFAPDSIDALKDFLLGFALATLKARAAK